MTIELIGDTELGDVTMGPGDRIITNGWRLSTKKFDLIHADPCCVSLAGEIIDPITNEILNRSDELIEKYNRAIDNTLGKP